MPVIHGLSCGWSQPGGVLLAVGFFLLPLFGVGWGESCPVWGPDGCPRGGTIKHPGRKVGSVLLWDPLRRGGGRAGSGAVGAVSMVGGRGQGGRWVSPPCGDRAGGGCHRGGGTRGWLWVPPRVGTNLRELPDRRGVCRVCPVPPPPCHSQDGAASLSKTHLPAPSPCGDITPAHTPRATPKMSALPTFLSLDLPNMAPSPCRPRPSA